ncbi:dynein light intermediate chain (DLIC) domain-containing protein [Ditylenchus destructor]|uniref:Dynein light intermediate chain n=1 Tax=Ditylenchus destructor TaxID=166010 RepID=A0AAD4R219_9BILA|nr:dynein light intermediate chain (DLIC) domain-containing protein [Ditylenchus destructor]
MVSSSSYLSQPPPGVASAHTNIQSDEIWSRILHEVGSKNNNATQGSVIVLGNDQSGKSSLIHQMTHDRDRPQFSSVLEYNYLTVQADQDDSANLPVWILDGKEELSPLLKFAFPPQLAKCAIVLCASLEQPGNILPALRKWNRVIDEQIKAHYPKEDIEQAKQAQVRFWQEYVEPIESSMHMDMGASRLDIEPVLLPPEPGVLEENNGAALIVVITKSDTHTDVNAEMLDKAQYHVRQFCLRHGAALIYTSAKEQKNTQLLYKYLAHRVFSLPFTTPAYIVEKDSIFVPSGWDSEQKLDIIKETLHDLDVPLLPQPQEDPLAQLGLARGAEGHSSSSECEDEQAFLNRLAAMQTAADANSSASPKRDVNPKAANPMAAQGDSSTLASFFNSLLQKGKDAGSVSPSPAKQQHPATAAQHNLAALDAEAHFQKMLSPGKPQAASTPAVNNNDPRLAEDAAEPMAPQPDFEEGSESELSSAGSGPTPREGQANVQ